MRVLVVLTLCSVVAAESELEKRLAQADVRSSRRIASLALKADKAGERATARRLYERVLVLDPRNGIARPKLGFKKKAGEWVRSSDAAVEVFARKDADLTRVAQLREERKKLEGLRAKDVLKVAAKYGTPASARPHLIAALRFAPRYAPLHEALGHEKIGDLYVRHGLTEFVREMPQRLERWKKCAEPVEAVATEEKVAITGVSGTRTVFRVGSRLVTTGGKLNQTIYTARRTECAHNLLRELFGVDVNRWDPSRVYFLLIKQFNAYLAAQIKDPAQLKRGLRVPTYFDKENKDLIIKRISSTLNRALDGYAHGVLFRSMQKNVSPQTAPDKWDTNRYSWFKEGVAAFGTLELLDSAETWFLSSGESSRKAEPSLPIPDPLTNAVSITYIREQFYDGTLPPMRDVFGNSLNNLDRIKALYASTFVRFLALYDPEGLRAFPKALRSQKAGAQAEQTMLALEEAFGKPGYELLRLWQAYLLELS